MRALEATRRAKEQEELRRHNELVSALREAGEKGATIIIGDHAGDIQIQQNSAGAKQKMEKHEGLDYEQVLEYLLKLKSISHSRNSKRHLVKIQKTSKRLLNRQ